MYHEEVRYYLSNENVGRVLLGTPPIGWDEDNKELVRSTEHWAVFTQLSNSLEFIKDGAEFITGIYEAYGTESEITLERFILVGLEGYELDYIGQLDLKTYSIENDKVSVEFLTGGLQSLIESQFNEKFEINRTTDINGNEISELELKRVFWEGRKILLQTYYETADDAILGPGALIANETYFSILNFPMTITAKSDQEFESVPNVIIFPDTPSANDFLNGLSVFIYPQRTRSIDVTISFESQITEWDSFPSGQNWTVAPFIFRYKFNETTQEWEYFSRSQFSGDVVYTLDSNGYGSPNPPIDYNATGTQNYEFVEGDAYVMGWCVVSPLLDTTQVGVALINPNVQVKFSEDSEFPASEFNAIRTHDLGNRLMEILTGQKNLFKSQFFGKQTDGYFFDSEFEKTLITSGEFIRQIPETFDVFTESQPAKLTTTLKDLFGLNNYFNLGWGVERNGNFEQLVIENKEYFFQDQVFLELGEVTNFKITAANELLYKSLSLGNDKAGDYEEVQGRNEFNVLNTFTTPLKTADEEYDVTGKIRADLTGAELARRKQFSNSPNEDTQYDKENFIISVKNTTDALINLRTWQDDFETEPIVYDPETAGNLLLTPFRSMLRHASFVKCGMIPYSLDFIRYASTTGNSDVATQVTGQPQRFENSDIVLNELNPAIFKAEYYEFSYPTTHEIRKKLFEKTNNIPNSYFLVKFTFREQTYSGWIINVSLNNEGNWKLIKNYK